MVLLIFQNNRERNNPGAKPVKHAAELQMRIPRMNVGEAVADFYFG